MKAIRCAIYTRKSSDEGLDQAFNSLDAQREACTAYILSQASEGWSALPDRYDDGGLSGGTLERPALQRLLADVAAGRIDVIVVYKVDRLSRSLFDFAKLVEAFEKADASFVSITQSFNTTSSMGRLTLNMLLSFAQFEREVTAERIRDKIAASKAKGMWMGGTPPLGYRPDGRSLAIVPEQAELVRHLFARYLALGNVRLLEDELRRERIAVPTRTLLSGKPIGGGAFTRGQLYKLLGNVTYTGRIAHKETSYPGRHPAILDQATFEAVAALLRDNCQGHRSRTRASTPSLLAGRIVDQDGDPLIATHAVKGNVRHRYYVSRALQRGAARTGSRIPAREIETAICARVAAACDDPLALATLIGAELLPDTITALTERGRDAGDRLRRRDRGIAHALIRIVRLQPQALEIACDAQETADMLGVTLLPDAPPTFTLRAEARLTRTGRAMRLVQDNGAALDGRPNPAVIKLLVRARRWWKQLRAGDLTITELAAAESVTPAYLTRIMRLAFLSPAVTDALLAGTLRAGVDVGALTLAGPLPVCWRAQAQALLPGVTVR